MKRDNFKLMILAVFGLCFAGSTGSLMGPSDLEILNEMQRLFDNVERLDNQYRARCSAYNQIGGSYNSVSSLRITLEEAIEEFIAYRDNNLEAYKYIKACKEKERLEKEIPWLQARLNNYINGNTRLRYSDPNPRTELETAQNKLKKCEKTITEYLEKHPSDYKLDVLRDRFQGSSELESVQAPEPEEVVRRVVPEPEREMPEPVESRSAMANYYASLGSGVRSVMD